MDKEKIISIAVLVLVAAGVVGLGVWGYKSKPEVAAVPSVAKVNGVAIAQTDYDSQLASAITSLKTQGVDTESVDGLAKIKAQVLDDLINNELIAQNIVKAGIVISPEEIEKQFQILVTQAGGADKLKEQLATLNLTEEQFRANINKQMGIQTYLLKNIDISSATATDDEALKFYNENIKGQTGAPVYKDVVEQIKQQIIGSKQQLLINTFIASLRTGATIEKSI